MKDIKNIEDIYPLTIIAMKHGKFAIIEGLAVYTCIISLQENEEIQYEPNEFMKKQWGHINYGIGNTINEAFENYKTRLNN